MRGSTLQFSSEEEATLTANESLRGYAIAAYDLLGRPLPIATTERSIDISNLPRGIFVLEAVNGSSIFRRQFLRR